MYVLFVKFFLPLVLFVIEIYEFIFFLFASIFFNLTLLEEKKLLGPYF